MGKVTVGSAKSNVSKSQPIKESGTLSAIEITKEVIVEVEKIVEVPKEVIKEIIVEKPIEVIKEIIVEKPIEVIKIVEKIIEIEKPVEIVKIVKNPVEVIREVEKIVTVTEITKLAELKREILSLKKQRIILIGMLLISLMLLGL